MDNFEKFIVDNEGTDTSRLMFSTHSWPVPEDTLLSEIPAKDLAICTIESRNKLKKKVPEWYAESSLAYPNTLCAEQCSSTETAFYKAELAKKILNDSKEKTIVDLTGGLGIDSWAFSKVADTVIYNEMNVQLARCTEHNYKALGINNIRISDKEINAETIEGAVVGASLVYIDPARRAKDGKKVFLIEDCQPDVLTLLPSIFQHSRHLLLKLSPMADISMVVERLNRSYEAYLEKEGQDGWNGQWIREIHTVARGGECKELLVWMDREWNGGAEIVCSEDEGTLRFTADEASHSPVRLPESTSAKIIFEPGKSLTKAGVTNALCQRFNLVKLAKFTHLFTAAEAMSDNEYAELTETLKRYGKVFKVIETKPLDKAAVKEIGKNYPHSEVSAKNIPMSSDELRSKLKVSSGDDAHIFGAKIELPQGSGNYLIVTQVVQD